MKIVINGESIDVAGQKGPPGEGVPTGGTTGQVLTKASGTDYDTEWVDPPEGGSEVYSTEETICGTWIDGRPVYKITVTTQIYSNATVNDYLYSFPANVNIDFPISIEGIALSGGTNYIAYPISSCSEGAENTANWIGYILVFFKKSSREVVFRWSSYNLTEGTIFATIKYVKTTDQATIQLDAQPLQNLVE